MDHSHHHHHDSSEQKQDDQEKHEHQAPGTKTMSTPGHDKHAGHHTQDFLKRFWICLGLTIPVLLLSHMIQQWLGIEIKFTGDKYVLLAL